MSDQANIISFLLSFDVQLDGNASLAVFTVLTSSRLDRQNPTVTSPIVVACHTSP